MSAPRNYQEDTRNKQRQPFCNPRIRSDFLLDKNAQERTLKILLSEAENWVQPGRTKIYSDARQGLLSTEKDPHRGNKKLVDIAELEHVYGKVRNPDENSQWTETNGDAHYISTEELIQSFKNRIQDLEAQLALANDREMVLLASATTAGLFTDRILGISETRSVEVNSTFVISGISVDTLISEELHKRMIYIRLLENDKSPDQFKQRYLIDHIFESRPLLMSACMTLIQDWIDAGRADGSQYLNRFERWSAVIGGILENAGIGSAIPTKNVVTKVTKIKDIYKNFLRNSFSPAPKGKVAVATVTEIWEKVVTQENENRNFGNLTEPSAQKKNQWMREVFTNADYTRAKDQSGETVTCWKGIALRG